MAFDREYQNRKLLADASEEAAEEAAKLKDKPKSRLSRLSLGKKGARAMKNKGKRKWKKLGAEGKVKAEKLKQSRKYFNNMYN